MLSLRTFSTIKIGGEAERVLRLSEFKRLLDEGRVAELPQPLRILGNGSNVLMDDRGLKGSVLVCRSEAFEEPEFLEETETQKTLRVCGGVFLPRFSKWASKEGLSGAEYMVGVPGTMGGALIQNAGANDQELKDLLLEARVLDLESLETKTLSAEDCGLSYRHSQIKHQALIVLDLVLKLNKADPKESEALLERNLNYRKQKTPYFKPSLGSIWTRLATKDGGWLYPGKLIEEAGLKGLQKGGASVSGTHANYIVNDGGASFVDVYELMQEVEAKVEAHSGCKLVREIDIWSDQI